LEKVGVLVGQKWGGVKHQSPCRATSEITIENGKKIINKRTRGAGLGQENAGKQRRKSKSQGNRTSVKKEPEWKTGHWAYSRKKNEEKKRGREMAKSKEKAELAGKDDVEGKAHQYKKGERASGSE